jgi:glycosyltransferase involved in cell wall biosynthesis
MAHLNNLMIKVLFNTPNPKLSGGPPTHLPLLSRELEKYVTVINYSYGRKEEYEAIFTKIFGRLMDLVNVFFIIIRLKPDIIHLNSAADKMAFIRDYLLIKLSRLFKVPVFIKFHGSFDSVYYENLSSLYKHLRRYILEKSSGIGVLSEYEKDFYIKSFPKLKENIFVVKNIIKDDFYNLVKKFSEKPEILFVSRCIKQKGIFDLLKAVPEVLNKYPDTKFIFIGSGKDENEFDDKCKSIGLYRNVIRYDQIDNTETIKFYESAWALAFPTHMPEGMPMVIAESMSAGLPVITSETRFSKSYLKEYESCLYIDPNSTESIVEKIILIIEDKGIKSRLSENSREIAKLFKAEIVAKEYFDIYKNLLSYSN